jgi:hypothetical protein
MQRRPRDERPVMPLRARLCGWATALGQEHRLHRRVIGSPDRAVIRLAADRLFCGELHSPADHFGWVQPDDRPGWVTIWPGGIRERLRSAADHHASGPPRRQHVVDHQGDVRVALRIVKLPGPGEVPATTIDRVQRGVIAPAEGNDTASRLRRWWRVGRVCSGPGRPAQRRRTHSSRAHLPLALVTGQQSRRYTHLRWTVISATRHRHPVMPRTVRADAGVHDLQRRRCCMGS